jgi:vesicle coat complex subunit
MPKQTRTEQSRAKYLRTACRAKGREERLERDEIAAMLEQTRDPDPSLRRAAVRSLCPCHVQANHPEIWDTLLVLATDPDADVRRDVLHTLADGSPREREQQILMVWEAMYQDPDPKIRKQVRYLLSQYRRTGKINIL